MQNTQFVCHHISPYADYFNILIVSCTYIYTHYVHIGAYPHATYVYSCTHTYKQTHTFVLLPWLPFESTYFKICCPMPIKCKQAQIIVDMNTHMWWVCIEELWWLLQVAARVVHTRTEQKNESASTPRFGTSWNQKQDQLSSSFGRASDLYLCLYNQLFALFRYVFKFLTL